MVVALLEQLVQGLKDVGFAVVMEFGPILEDLTALEKFVKIQVGESMNDVVEEKGVVRLDYLVGIDWKPKICVISNGWPK